MKVYRLIASFETEIYDIVINDQTQLQRRLMAEDKIVCPVVVNSLLNFEIGDYIKWNGAKYYINRDPVLDEISDVEFRYNITFEGEIYNLIDLLFMLDRETVFQLTEFTIYGNLQFFVDKITAQVGWPAAIITSTAKAKNVTFTGVNCREALNKLCSEFSCEFSVNGKQLTFRDKIENVTALTFNRGRNAGLYTLTKEPVDDGNTITKAYIFGSTRNITFLYGHPRLTVPAITNTLKYKKIVEKNVVFESIWPQFIGTVATVGSDFLSITCPQIDFNLTDAQLNGIFSKIVFLDGDLAGNQFDIPSNSYDPVTKTVKFKQIVKTDGQSLPTNTGTWAPRKDDKFTFVDLNMLPAYITDAETRLTAAGTEWLNYYSKLRVKYKLVFDPRYLRNKPALNIGDIVTITGGIQLRIIGMQYPILYPERVTAEISNFRDEFYENKISTQISDTLQKISEVKAENSISTVVLKHIWYDTPTGKLKTDVGLHVGGTIEASEEVIAWVSNAVSGTVLAGLTGQDPIYKVSESVVGLKFDPATLAVVGGKLTVVGGGGTPTGTGGTVTSVELTLPGEFNVTGGPITIAGTFAGTWKSQLQGKVLASPVASGGIPTFRALELTDIPISAWAKSAVKPAYTKAEVGLDLVANRSDYYHAGNLNLSTVPFTASTGTFSGGVTAAGLLIPFAESDIIYTSGFLITPNSYNSFRQGTDHSFNIDTYNGGAPVNALKIFQSGAATFSNIVTALGGNSTNWNISYSKTIPFTVTDTKVTIDRDLEVTGNITASKDVIAYVAGAVTSDVLSSLSGVAPLWKPTASTIGIKLDAAQFQINAANELQIIPGTLQPSGNYATVAFVNSSIATLTNLAPAVLDTFAELASAMGGDPNFSVTVLNQIATKEPAFTKNTAFNKNFGITAGTVTQGDDSRLSNARIASDVSLWAKSAVKPDYTYSEISGTPALNYLPISGGTLTGILSGTSATFSGSVGVGTVSPTARLTVQGTGTAKTEYLEIKNTSSFSVVYMSPGQIGDVDWMLMAGYPNSGDFTIRQAEVGDFLTIQKTTGKVTFAGPVTTPSLIAPLYTIRNASGVLQWTVSVGTGERLEFKNASGVTEMVLTQAGEIHAKTEITAYSSIV